MKLKIITICFLLLFAPQVSAKTPINETSTIPIQASYEPYKPFTEIKLEELPTYQWKFPTNLYEPRNCTFGVASWIPIPQNLGDARNWDDNSPGKVNDTPTVNSIAQTDSGYWGHVALVLDISGDQVLIREMNYDYNGSVRERWANKGEFRYIHYVG